VLSIAAVIDFAIHEAGLYLKQSEVHGMAQRGGAVSAFVRISDQPISSDLIAQGGASMVLSVEPMEALRYTQLLRPDGWIVTDITPMVNVDSYPQTDALYQVLFSVPRLVALDAARLAHKAGSIKVQNTVVLGAAASHLPIPTELLEKQLQKLFSAKGERIVKANINAFRIGDAASRFAASLVAAGVASEVIARVLPRMAFEPHAIAPQCVAAWCRRLLRADAAQFVRTVFEADEVVALDSVAA
jgi:indolepyruvate ferredoxin oxidoreductase beta subunit